jgi:hypothetical protein
VACQAEWAEWTINLEMSGGHYKLIAPCALDLKVGFQKIKSQLTENPVAKAAGFFILIKNFETTFRNSNHR